MCRLLATAFLLWQLGLSKMTNPPIVKRAMPPAPSDHFFSLHHNLVISVNTAAKRAVSRAFDFSILNKMQPLFLATRIDRLPFKDILTSQN